MHIFHQNTYVSVSEHSESFSKKKIKKKMWTGGAPPPPRPAYRHVLNVCFLAFKYDNNDKKNLTRISIRDIYWD